MNDLLPTGLRRLLLRSLKIAERLSGSVPVAYHLAGIMRPVNSIGIAPIAFGEMVLT